MSSNVGFNDKIVNAAKWSTITQFVVKIVTPVTTMILARILAPEAFAVLTTVTMIISFAEMFSDAGFQKYLVQREFKHENEKYMYANVAFWTNFGIAILFWVIIFLFCEPIAKFVGNPGLGYVISIACVQLPLASLSSIQMALYSRDFNFKTVFWMRLVSAIIPFFITIPLAFLGFGYWSLIIGTIFGSLSSAVILTVQSTWKPKWCYKFKVLKKMLSFSVWSLIESISIWLTIWVDSFIIGNVLSEYYLGLYKTSTSMVNALFALITAAATPVLFTTLSRLQNDPEQFNKVYFAAQRLVATIILPMGVGVYLYSDLATQLFLGTQWSEASGVIGIWALTSSIMIVFGHFCSEVYRAKGRPKLSLLAQVLHLVVLIPVCIICSAFGFWMLVFVRSWLRMEFVLVHFIIMNLVVGISFTKTFRNVIPPTISASIMGLIGFFLKEMSTSVLWSIVSIAICISFYIGLLYQFSDMRQVFNAILRGLKGR